MYVLDRVKEALISEIKTGAEKAGIVPDSQLPDILLEVPKEKAHGDFSTNLALQLTKIAKRNPREIAQLLVDHIDKAKAGVVDINIAGPGFINFILDKRYVLDVIPQVLQAQQEYGRVNVGNNQKIQVEFVSANPTGSLHLGHARGAAVGDALSHVLSFAGYDVSREYYINDAGNQVINLAKSIEARYLQALGQNAELPEDGYQGEDIIEFGQQLVAEEGERLTELSDDERLEFFLSYGLKKQLQRIKDDLADFGVIFDEWFSENSLYDSGQIDVILQKLRDRGEVFEEEGATWLRTTTYGDDKDRVLIKNDGTYTYLTPDIAYHNNKFSRGFEQLINIWGADHHGYVPRMKAAMLALGYDADQLVVLISQMVSLYQNGEKVKMSKRTGKAVTMRELMDEVGTDAMRYFFTMRGMDSHLDFDMDLAISKSNENPVYYVQYAHARICSIYKQAAEQGIELSDWKDIDFNVFVEASVESGTDSGADSGADSDADSGADSGAGADSSSEANSNAPSSFPEYDLLLKLAQLSEEVQQAAEQHAPHRLVRYVFDLAAQFHSYYRAERVITENAQLTQARLALLQATQIVIKNVLSLIGVSAPEQM